MKYFIGTINKSAIRKPIKLLPTIGKFNSPEHFKDLQSISIISEDGRELTLQYRHSIWEKQSDQCANKQKMQDEIFYFVNPHCKTDSPEAKMFYAWGTKLQQEEFMAKHNIFCFEPNETLPLFTFRARPEFVCQEQDDWALFQSIYGWHNPLTLGFPKEATTLEDMMESIAIDNLASQIGIATHKVDRNSKELTQEKLRIRFSIPILSVDKADDVSYRSNRCKWVHDLLTKKLAENA